MYVVRGAKHDQGSVWYLDRCQGVLIYPKLVVWGARHSLVLFNIQKSNFTYQFTQGLWSEEPSMTKVLFDT